MKKSNLSPAIEVMMTSMMTILSDAPSDRKSEPILHNLRQKTFEEGTCVTTDSKVLVEEIKSGKIQMFVDVDEDTISEVEFVDEERAAKAAYRVEACVCLPGRTIISVVRASERIYFSFESESTKRFFKTASHLQVQNDLIDLAGRMGFVHGKRNFIDAVDGQGIEKQKGLDFSSLTFSETEDILCDTPGNAIYQKGKWSRLLNDDGSELECDCPSCSLEKLLKALDSLSERRSLLDRFKNSMDEDSFFKELFNFPKN